MKKGITSTLAFELEIQVSDVEQVIFTFKEKVNSEEYLLQKEYPSESVIFEDNKFKCKLTQEETDSLSNTFFVEAQINLSNKSVIKSDICKKIMPPTLWTTFVEDNESSGEEEIISLTFTDYVEGGGSGGTTNYNELSNKPRFNGIEWVGNKTDSDMGIATKGELQTKADKSDTYTKEETNTFLNAKADKDTTYTKTETDNLLGGKQDTLADGNGVKIENDEISVDLSSDQSQLLKFLNGQLILQPFDIAYNELIRQELANSSIPNSLASKTYVDNLMSGATKWEFVSQLPTENIDIHTIYFVPKESAETDNIYDEWVYAIKSRNPDVYDWELLGTSQVDLSNYYNKSETDNLLGGKQDTLTAGTNITIDANNVISASGSGRPITDTAQGSTISLTDSADSPLDAISIMGKSIQNGTPTIDNPIPIVDITTEEIEITNGTNTQTANLTKTLRGIPVSSGGNYTDNNNQQWVCDTIERYKDGSGKYIQRVGVKVFDGSENWRDYSYGSGFVTTTTNSKASTLNNPKTLFNICTLTNANTNIDNTYLIGSVGTMICAPTQNGIRLNATQFKSYLTNNNATLEYVLETPIETPLTSEELAELNLDTYYPSTTITANTDVVVEYVVDIETALSTKQDKTDISTDTTSTTVSLTLADNHEYRYTQELSSLTLTMPSGDFISSIVFASGSTPTSMTYDSSIKWSGDDVTNGQFVPTEKTYNIVMWYDGININGVVRGV